MYGFFRKQQNETVAKKQIKINKKRDRLRAFRKRSRNVSVTLSVDIKNKGIVECCRSCC